MTVTRSAVRRGAWGFADQAVSSLTNFIMSFAVLRAVSIEAFGAFTIAYTTYTLLMGLTRGAISETLVVRFSDVPRPECRAAVAAATGATLPAALLAAAGTALVGAALGGAVGVALLALAVVLPGLLLQDAWRFAFFAAGEPEKAFVNDLVWGVLQLTGIGVVFAVGDPSVGAFVLAWGLAGVVAGGLGVLQAGLLPDLRAAWPWLRSHGDLASRYLVEATLRRGTGQLMFVAIGAIAGLEAVGLLNAARVLLGPINIVYLGFVAVGIPEAVRVWRARPSRLAFAVRLTAVVLGGLALVAGGVLMAIPSSVGERLLDKWDEALRYIVPITISVAATGAIHAMIVGLRALEAAERSLRSQILMSMVTAAFTVGGAWAGGAGGAALGLMLGRGGAALVVWRDFEVEARLQLARAASRGPT